MTIRRSSSFFAAGLFLLACSGPQTRSYSGPTVLVSSTARAACEAIDIACDPHEHEGGLAKECHDIALSSPEATCVARKAECLSTCPPVR